MASTPDWPKDSTMRQAGEQKFQANLASKPTPVHSSSNIASTRREGTPTAYSPTKPKEQIVEASTSTLDKPKIGADSFGKSQREVINNSGQIIKSDTLVDSAIDGGKRDFDQKMPNLSKLVNNTIGERKIESGLDKVKTTLNAGVNKLGGPAIATVNKLGGRIPLAKQAAENALTESHDPVTGPAQNIMRNGLMSGVDKMVGALSDVIAGPGDDPPIGI